VLSDSTRMCELLVGLPEVNVLDVVKTSEQLRVTIETRGQRPVWPGCGGGVRVKDRRHGRQKLGESYPGGLSYGLDCC